MLINIQARVPRKFLCMCLRPKGRQNFLIEGYKRLKNEIHIVNILRQLRVLSAMARKGMTKDEWKDKCFQKGL